MKPEETKAEAYKEQIEAKLQEARTKLDELDATVKERKAKAEIEAIIALRARRDEIQARIREFQNASEARASQMRADIDAKVANFLEELGKLVIRVKALGAAASRM